MNDKAPENDLGFNKYSAKISFEDKLNNINLLNVILRK